MSSSFIPLDSVNHRMHGWKPVDNFGFAAADAMVAVALPEIAVLLPYFPLAFAMQPAGGYRLVALQALHPGQNLFLDKQGRWLVPAFPMQYQLFPFLIQQARTGEETRPVISFNRASGLYREAPNGVLGEERFFDDEGNSSPRLQEILNRIGLVLNAREVTQRAVDALVEANLLVRWEFPFENPAPESSFLNGVFRIDEKLLKGLSGSLLESLASCGALAVAYGQLYSQLRLAGLRRIYGQRHPELVSPAKLVAGGGDLSASIDSLLGGLQNSGTISFEGLIK